MGLREMTMTDSWPARRWGQRVCGRTRRGLLGLLAAMLVAGLAGCPSGQPSKDEIVIGHYASLSGTEATFGQSTDNGIKLALEEINAAGGIHGKPIRLITLDEKGDATEVGNVVMRLVTQDRVTAVLGEVASGLSLIGAPICQEHGVPMISPSSTNPQVTEVGDMIFRVCFIDPFQGGVCARFAREHEDVRARSAAMLYDQAAPYSTGLAAEFKQAFQKLGGKIVAEEVYNAGDQDFSAQLTKIRAASPDLLFIPGYYTDVGNIAIQARKLGIKVPLLGGDGWNSSKLPEIGGKDIDGCYYSDHYSPEDPSPKVQEFIGKYQKKYGARPDGLAALGYDAAYILADAMKRAKSLGGQDLAAAIAATKDFDGVTGKITLGPDRNAVKPAVILKLVDGVPKYVATYTPE